MEARLKRIEDKLDKLIISVEHRLTAVETTQRGIRWFICVFVAAAVAIFAAL
jgi:hypothetical protein